MFALHHYLCIYFTIILHVKLCTMCLMYQTYSNKGKRCQDHILRGWPFSKRTTILLLLLHSSNLGFLLPSNNESRTSNILRHYCHQMKDVNIDSTWQNVINVEKNPKNQGVYSTNTCSKCNLLTKHKWTFCGYSS